MKCADLTGQRFGRLAVVRNAGKDKRGAYLWECLCDCGSTCVMRSDHLKRGEVQSCGCLNRERAKETASKTGKANRKHGGNGTRLYSVWHGMKDRCYNSGNPYFEKYGGRGITVCAEWRTDFAAFRAWALVNGYASGLSIDRVDNNAGYSPDNCRWITAKGQARNRRSNRVISGKSVAAWADKACVSYSAILRRLNCGWSIQDACTTPAGKKP